MARLTENQRINVTILVAALGYFVDVFDIQLFSMLRVPSLKSLGLSGDELTLVGTHLLNWQMAGMLIGGILWGVLGDRKGRVYVLFGTILLYSLGNIANAFVTTIPAYAAARFFTGLGLAGEIGTGITLASELLPKETRCYGSSAIVGIGVLGPLVAGFMADALDWHACYIAGGILGLLLLALRISVNESDMFKAMKESGLKKGHFGMLFNNRKRFTRYVLCVLSGVPIWFFVGVIVIFSPEIGTALKIEAPIRASTSVMSCYVGLSLGGFISGVLSQIFESRKKIMALFILGVVITCFVILSMNNISSSIFYVLIVVGGFLIGYWTLFLTTTTEQFGTNLRTTAAASASNFVRASIIVNSSVVALMKPSYGLITSIEIDGTICCVLALLAVWKLPETFGRNLDYNEQ